jgi:hypothetical protein
MEKVVGLGTQCHALPSTPLHGFTRNGNSTPLMTVCTDEERSTEDIAIEIIYKNTFFFYCTLQVIPTTL